ncbi:MAG: transposase [Verrucomicrobiota bacterium]|nr:transposase [Verrucomicrobiota bacterium]
MLNHIIPLWVKDSSLFFVTICAAMRGTDELIREGGGVELIRSVQHLHQCHSWFAHLFLVMPDHVHALLAVPPDTRLAAHISAWKGYTAKQFSIKWQTRFFDHRLRSDESLDEKACYIRMNPVRAGLVTKPQEWPYIFEADVNDGSAGTPRPTI